MTTEINLTHAQTDVRGGGYGNDAWIAKVTGLDPKYGLAREFCRRDTSGLSRSGRSGLITFEMLGPGIYEFRNFCVGSTSNNWEWSGFVQVSDDGKVSRLSRTDVVDLVGEMS